MVVRRVDSANRVLLTSPEFTIGVKYQFRQGFYPDQRSGNPNHPRPPYRVEEVCNFVLVLVYRVIQNKRTKIKQDIGDAPLNNLR